MALFLKLYLFLTLYCFLGWIEWSEHPRLHLSFLHCNSIKHGVLGVIIHKVQMDDRLYISRGQ